MTSSNPDIHKAYLTLLRKCLTNTLHNAEPDHDSAHLASFVHRFTNHYIKSDAVSMLPKSRFDNLEYCINDILKNNIPGDLIETGVWRAGATIFMRAVLKANLVTDRTVWVADSFEGLPEPDAEKFPIEAKAHAGPVMTKAYQHFAVGLEVVKKNFSDYGLLDEQVKFLKGWFKESLPTAPIERLALLRLDGDYYESTMDGLVHLYDKLSVGGFVIVDDYGEDLWTYCRKAVDDFRDERNINTPIIKVDSKCYYWKKS